MSKYQEALDNLCNKMFCGVECVNSDVCSLLKPLQELVDKATPKKPIKSNNPLFDYMVFCPACNKSMSFKNYYCGSCGQAVDWSGEND